MLLICYLQGLLGRFEYIEYCIKYSDTKRIIEFYDFFHFYTENKRLEGLLVWCFFECKNHHMFITPWVSFMNNDVFALWKDLSIEVMTRISIPSAVKWNANTSKDPNYLWHTMLVVIFIFDKWLLFDRTQYPIKYNKNIEKINQSINLCASIKTPETAKQSLGEISGWLYPIHNNTCNYFVKIFQKSTRIGQRDKKVATIR